MTDKQPFIGAVAGVVLMPVVKKAATTILRAGLKEAVKRLAERDDNAISPAAAGKVAEDLAIEIAKDPRAVNAVSAEPAYQSRVVVGSSAVIAGQFVPAVAIPQLVIVANILLPGTAWDITADMQAQAIAVTGAVVTLWGAGYALYGRLRSGLKPLFSRS